MVTSNSTDNEESEPDYHGYCTVANRLGIDLEFLLEVKELRDNQRYPKRTAQLLVHQRFYGALVLNDLISNRMSLDKVAIKFQLDHGDIQSLKQNAAIFAGMLASFCGKLDWTWMELLLQQCQQRITFGIRRELFDLQQVSYLTPYLAKQLYRKGKTTQLGVATVHLDFNWHVALLLTCIIHQVSNLQANWLMLNHPKLNQYCFQQIQTKLRYLSPVSVSLWQSTNWLR